MPPKYPLSDHYDGKRFHNILAQRKWSFRDLLRWLATRRIPDWEKTDVLGTPRPAPRVGRGRMVVTFINHMTFLIQVNGLNILTDPVWSSHPGPLGMFGPKRQTLPALDLSELPPLDLVLISHNHYDHMDIPTLKTLHRTHHPVFVVPLGNAKHLSSLRNVVVHELDWLQEINPIPDIAITAVPARHFSSRTPFDRDQALWCGFVVDTGKYKVYFAGDTGWDQHFGEIKKIFSDLDVAMIPSGAFLPPLIMQDIHLNPEEAIKAFKETGARHGIACHFGTFQLGDDTPQLVASELITAMTYHEVDPEKFLIGRHGLVLNI